MKKMFMFTERKNVSSNLILFAKVFKIFYIVLASLSAFFLLIQSIILVSDNSTFFGFLMFLIAAALSFFLLVFFGWVIENLLLGFSSIVHNQHDELVIKQKDFEPKVASPSNDLYSRLHQLNELKNANIITEEEFEEKKKNFLSGI